MSLIYYTSIILYFFKERSTALNAYISNSIFLHFYGSIVLFFPTYIFLFFYTSIQEKHCLQNMYHGLY